MAGEASGSNNTSKKKSKLVRQESGKCSEIETDKCVASSSSQTTRGGLRVYKIVVLGDGGVGKSGMFKSILTFLLIVTNNGFRYSCHIAVCKSQFFGLS